MIGIRIVLLSLLFINCQSVRKNDKCNQLYQNARMFLTQYYEAGDTLSLIKAKKSLDSINCDMFRYKSNFVDLKITVLILNHKYREGVEFVNSLDSSDFSKPYQKNLFVNNFKALDCKDNRVKDSLYTSTIRQINDYLLLNKDEVALFDLFMFKSKIQDTLETKREIDSLKYLNIYDSVFLNNLTKSIY